MLKTDRFWIVGTGKYTETWSNGQYSLPTLSKECRVVCPLRYQEMHFDDTRFFKVETDENSWFIDLVYFEFLREDFPHLHFRRKERQSKQLIAKEIIVDIERLMPIDDYDNDGGYIQRCAYNGSKLPEIGISTINTSPTVYIGLRIDQLTREIVRQILMDHPKLEYSTRYHESNAVTTDMCPNGRFESLWLRRRDERQGIGTQSFSDPEVDGDLKTAVGRSICRLIYTNELRSNIDSIFIDFEKFFKKKCRSLWSGRISEGSFNSERNALENVFKWSYHATELMHREELRFWVDDLEKVAKNTWEMALQLEKTNGHNDGWTEGVKYMENYAYMRDFLDRQEDSKKKIWEQIMRTGKAKTTGDQ